MEPPAFDLPAYILELRRAMADAAAKVEVLHAAMGNPPAGCRFVFRVHFTTHSVLDVGGAKAIWSKAVEERLPKIVKADLGIADSKPLSQMPPSMKRDLAARGIYNDKLGTLNLPSATSAQISKAVAAVSGETRKTGMEAFIEKQAKGSHGSPLMSLCVDKPTAGQLDYIGVNNAVMYVYLVRSSTLIQNTSVTYESEWFAPVVLSSSYFVATLSREEAAQLV